ncbi:MAG TPA: hypothetical protein VK184_17610 [Nostocaceae cyanobacterium]|nr:hypothetical protein [Nostocaceae cyanobacterium]
MNMIVFIFFSLLFLMTATYFLLTKVACVLVETALTLTKANEFAQTILEIIKNFKK